MFNEITGRNNSLLFVYIFAIQQSALSPEVRNIHGWQEHYVSAETVLHGMQVCNAVRITCLYSMHYIVSRRKNTLKHTETSWHFSFCKPCDAVIWHFQKDMWCDVCWGNSLSIWKGRARASRTTDTLHHTRQVAATPLGSIWDPFGIHLGSIGQLHHNFGILDDSVSSIFQRKEKPWAV